MLTGKTFQPVPRKRGTSEWYIIDGKNKVVGRLATILARVITGKHKPTVSKSVDCGDHIIVLNADKVVFTRNKFEDKIYYKHTGYIGGLKETSARDMRTRKPEEILRLAVWGMTNKSSLARKQMKKLRLIKGDEHEHKAQEPKNLPAYVLRPTNYRQDKK